MSSFDNKDNKYKSRKLSFKENLHFDIHDGNTRDGYIKADQMYLFRKNDIEFRIVGKTDKELLRELLELIVYLKKQGILKVIIQNN